jgi:small subunit ribosomal protein S11
MLYILNYLALVFSVFENLIADKQDYLLPER